jgi:hypothetical protein
VFHEDIALFVVVLVVCQANGSMSVNLQGEYDEDVDYDDDDDHDDHVVVGMGVMIDDYSGSSHLDCSLFAMILLLLQIP